MAKSLPIRLRAGRHRADGHGAGPSTGRDRSCGSSSTSRTRFGWRARLCHRLEGYREVAMRAVILMAGLVLVGQPAAQPVNPTSEEQEAVITASSFVKDAMIAAKCHFRSVDWFN